MIIKITSLKNNVIKEIVDLQTKSKLRKSLGLAVIEGIKEIEIAINSGLTLDKVLFCPKIIDFEQVKKICGEKINSANIYELSEQAFSKISYRETTGGLVVIAKTNNYSLESIKITQKSLFIILESVEKPGNLGAIARIADAANVDAIIVCDPLADVYNPNAIRASLGCVFSVKIINSNSENVFSWLRKNDIISYAAELRASEFYHKFDYNKASAIVFGTEASGLSEKWINFADKRIKIPMLGSIDSLNVSTSVAVMTFEILRQRNFLV